ncbi:MmpS family transport accessory protein [Actinophytocola sp.]|uniref:MmpS family transport accessory protein n=1 Tax=Actinophytocola sp. TaxID=1872138 RepID=UPI003D6BF848
MQPGSGHGVPDPNQPQVPNQQFPLRFPSGPPRKSNLPLIIGAIVAVVVVGVASVLFFTLPGGEDNNADNTGDSNELEKSTSAAPTNSITYEITGTSESPPTVVYTGSDAKDFEKTVSSLPWSVTVDSAPDDRRARRRGRDCRSGDAEHDGESSRGSGARRPGVGGHGVRADVR